MPREARGTPLLWISLLAADPAGRINHRLGPREQLGGPGRGRADRIRY